ncbi:hypothetical protein M231_01787 [Tremella mesenterica]|uniref:Glucose receptor Git3 N-terminal domain-containing protein n=1 Tax=Tremella mesenterica TaxID=5217 RepID=A0A4Q1BSE2_TREME|nr:hypothetical protein M231_01787 [Tremella mesenterica]
MLWLECHGRPTTTRTRAVESLVVSDLMLGIVGLIGNAVDMSIGLKDGTPTCDGLGFMLTTVFWIQHMCTLLLAFTTYMILIYPLHSITSLIEKHWIYIWISVYIIAIAVGVLGYELYGYFPNGGICYYGQNSGLYGELIQFIPRGFVFICVTFFYSRLFVFLRRPDKIRSPYTNSPTGGSFDMSHIVFRAPAKGVMSLLRKKHSDPNNHPIHIVEPKQTPDPQSPQSDQSPNVGEIQARRRSSTTQPMTPDRAPSGEVARGETPPWEHVELPVFQVDGQRYGGSSGTGRSSTTSLWGNWRGLGGKEYRKRSSIASSSSPRTKVTRMNSLSSGRSVITAFSSPRSQPNRLDPVTSTAIHVEFAPDDDDAPTQLPSSFHSSQPLLFLDPRRRRSAELSASIASSFGVRTRQLSGISPISLDHSAAIPFPSLANNESPSGPYDPQTRRPSVLSTTTAGTVESKDSSGAGPPIVPTTTTGGHQEPPPFVQPSLSDRDSTDVENQRGAEDEEEDEFDLMRMLQESRPPGTGDERVAQDEGEIVEFVPESMASYLNRKTALLMLWFPLAYVFLFSVSLIRIIYDFVGTPPTALRAVSRWFIFAQGMLDAIIYGLVEWHTKRVVRRRVRKGHFSPSGTHQSNQTGSFLTGSRFLGSRGSAVRPPHQTVTRLSPIVSQAPSPAPPTSSQVGPMGSIGMEEHETPSILQTLYLRKGSLATSDGTTREMRDIKEET